MHRGTARVLAFGAALAVWGVGRPASAQSTPNAIPSANSNGMDTHLFRPAMNSKGLFTVNGTDILGAKDISVGLILDYAHVLLRTPFSNYSQLIDNSFQGTLQFNYGIANRVVVGLDLPIESHVRQPRRPAGPGALRGQVGPDQARFPGHRLPRCARQVARLEGRTRVRRRGGRANRPGPRHRRGQRRGRSGVLVLAPVDAREANRLHGSASPRGERRLPRPHLERHDPPAEGRHLRRRQLVDVRGRCEPARPRVARPRRRDVRHLPHLRRRERRRQGEQRGRGRHQALHRAKLVSDARRRRALHGRLRGRRLSASSSASSSSRRSATATATASRTTSTSARTIPRTSTASRTTTAAPTPTTTTTASPTSTIAAPTSPKTATATRTKTAAPRAATAIATATASPTRNDKCPDEPEDRDGFQDDDGCPDPDNDKDGIPDKLDKCPNDPEDKDGFEDADGCPDPGQRSRRHPRRQGQVPERSRDLQRLPGRRRLPRQGQRHHPGQQHRHPRQDQVHDGAAPRSCRESNPILDAVATTLSHHPEFTLVEVAGHADERASDEYNLKLTQDRVNSVVRALIARGLEKSRAAQQGVRRVLPDRRRPQRGGVGAEPPRRVQNRQDPGRPHRSRPRLRERHLARRLARAGALAPKPSVTTFAASGGP